MEAKSTSFRRSAIFLCLMSMVVVAAISVPAPVRAQASPSFYCNSVTSLSLDECLALQGLYKSLGGDNWTDNSGWLSSMDLCTWAGVNCQMTLQKMTHIMLPGNNLQGQISEAFGRLELNWLDLSENQISGPLPFSLWQSQIANLMLSDNAISGRLPPDIGQLGSSVEVLDLSNNQFSGPLPAQLGQLSRLSILNISGNQFEGQLPLSLMDIPSLYMFKFSDTNLCVPDDAAFQSWLNAVPNVESSGLICDDTAPITQLYQIAYADGGDIYLYSEATQESQKLTDSGLDCCIAWAPQGNELYFLRDRQGQGRLIAYDLAEGVERELGPPELRVSSRPAASSDGRRLIFTHNIDIEGQEFINNRSCLAWLDLEGGGTVNVSCKDGVYLSWPMLDPNEASVVVTEAGFEFAQLLSFQLLPGSDGRVIGCCGQPTLFPDSPSMAVIANRYMAWSLFTDGTSSGIFRLPLYGGEPAPLLKAEEQVFDPDISPDGSRMIYTRGLEDSSVRIEIMDLYSGEIEQLFPGDSPAWGPAVEINLNPLDPDLLAEKAQLIQRLAQSTYSGRYGAAAGQFEAYSEKPSQALVALLEEDPAAVGADQSAAFGRLVMQERALAETLADYELLRDDFADSLVDMASMAVGSAFFAAVADDGDLAAALADQTAAVVEDSLLLGFAFIDDPELRQAAEVTVAALFDLLETATLDPAHFAELIVGETLRQEAAARLTAYLVNRVQPTIDQGVRSVTMDGEPRWQVTGTELLAATQTDAVATISQNDSQGVRGQYEDVVRGLALNELLTDIGDLATQGGVPFAPVASITGRVLNVILNVSSMWLLADSMDCVAAVSQLAGEMAFEPPEKLLLNCDDSRVTGLAQAAPQTPSWIGRDSWQQSIYPRLDAAANSLLDAADGSSWSFAGLQGAQQELSAASHPALLALLPPAGSRLTPELAAAGDHLLRLQGESVSLLAAAAVLERNPGDDAYTAQFNDAREEMGLQLSEVAKVSDLLPAEAAEAVPIMLLQGVPSRLVTAPGQPTTIALSVHNAGTEAASSTVLTSRMGESELGRYAVPETAPAGSTNVAISLPPMELGSYLLTISLEESGRRDFQFLRLLVTDEPITAAPATQQDPVAEDTATADSVQAVEEDGNQGPAPTSGRSWISGLLFALFSLLAVAAVVWAIRRRPAG